MFRFGKPPGRIFINYRRDDAVGVAGRLGDSLNRYFGDGRVFRDVEGIDAGANFEDVLQHTAQAADAMIVLIGPRWLGITDAQGRARLHQAEDWVAPNPALEGRPTTAGQANRAWGTSCII